MAFLFTSPLQSSTNYGNEYRGSPGILPFITIRHREMSFRTGYSCYGDWRENVCLMTLDGQWEFYNLKVAPDYGVELCERFSGIRPGYHMNKRHWISVDFYGDVPDRLQEQFISHSYCQTAKKLPKNTQTQFGLTELLDTLWKKD